MVLELAGSALSTDARSHHCVVVSPDLVTASRVVRICSSTQSSGGSPTMPLQREPERARWGRESSRATRRSARAMLNGRSKI